MVINIIGGFAIGAFMAILFWIGEYDRKKYRDEIIAAVRGYSEIEQRKLDEIVGHLELLLKRSLPIKVAIDGPVRAEKRKGPPVIQDFEASQKATLEEYREQ